VKNIFSILILAGILSSCGTDKQKYALSSGAERIEESGMKSAKPYDNSELTPTEYVSWMRNPVNGLWKSKTIEDLEFSAQYKPYEYIACLEEKKSEMKDSIVKRKLSELEGMDYLDLRITIKEGQGELLKHKLSSVAEYNNRINYFSFKMQKDISLVVGKDTIPCSLFHFERAYDVAPYSQFVLGFSQNKKRELSDMTLVIQDQIFHKGIIKLSFSESDLLKIPKLKAI
jgi:hypothetical protein